MATRSDRALRPKVLLVNRAVVLREDTKVLLVLRSKNSSYMPSTWELPGGKLDAGQDVSNALEREVLEETGLVVVPMDKLAYWHSEILTSGKYKGLPYVGLVGIAKSVGGKVTLSNEHDDYAWESVEGALNYDITPETRAALTVLTKKIV